MVEDRIRDVLAASVNRPRIWNHLVESHRPLVSILITSSLTSTQGK